MMSSWGHDGRNMLSPRVACAQDRSRLLVSVGRWGGICECTSEKAGPKQSYPSPHSYTLILSYTV